MSTNSIPSIGAHVSVEGGLHKGIERALAIGADCMQIFGSSPQQWAVRFPNDDDVKKFHELKKKHRFGPVYLHASYLVNLASSDRKIWHTSVGSLVGHLKIAEIIGAEGLIFHIGAGKEQERGEAIANVKRGVERVLAEFQGKAKLVMENSASKKKIGADPKEIGELFCRFDSNRVSVCVDTAHAFEAGVIESFTAESVRGFTDSLDKEIGLKHIAVIHANDSRTKYNSGHDVHENIGEGYIGLEGFQNLAKEKRLQDKVWLLEVPGFGGKGPDKENVDRLRQCFF